VAKRKSTGSSSADGSATGKLRALSPELLIGAALLILLAVGAYYGWKKWGVPVTEGAEYRLATDKIQISPQPAWIRSDVRLEAARDGSLENLSMFDSELSVRVYRAFEMHAWVAHVNSVVKRAPGRVVVDLNFRRPVAWVEVPAGVLPTNEVGLLPVDVEGVLLPPGDFGPDQADEYIRVSVANLTPCGLPGTPWGDGRVTSAAQIADLLPNQWRHLGFRRIVVSQQMDGTAKPEAIFSLTTQRGLRFVWGSAPGREKNGEPTATEKKNLLERLAFAAQELEIPSGNWDVDLRDPAARLPTGRTAHQVQPTSY
jgi:hypothetical protein